MRIALTLAYDGTAYAGWQRQREPNTVQEILEEAVFKASGERVSTVASGRTDAGVHALGQVVHFDINTAIPPERIYMALNTYLPPDIRATESFEVSADFNARKSAKRKTYVYRMYKSGIENPLLERFSLRVSEKIDITRMSAAANALLGKHDFKAFCSSGSSVKDTVREIYEAYLSHNDNLLELILTGSGFLYNMVRIIAGTLVEIGEGRKSVEAISEAVAFGRRSLAGKTAPAKGLILLKVEY